MKLLILWLLPPVAGFLLDALLGDPQWLYHPVRIIGNLISLLEKLLRRLFPKTPGGLLTAGVFLAVAVPAASFFVSYGISLLGAQLGLIPYLLAETMLIYMGLAARSLQKASMKVYSALQAGDLDGARHALSHIVGRETQALDREDVVKAAVETVAENTSDGVVAPLLYACLGGAPLLWFYKGVNTLDSMVGYKNEAYLHLGRASARLDDVANLIPARLAALCMVCAAPLCKLDGKNAFRIWRRDNRAHSSPNSAQTESACAGALRLQLGGDAVYFGQVHHKPTIGDAARPAIPEDISLANRLMWSTSVLALSFLTLCKAITLVV